MSTPPSPTAPLPTPRPHKRPANVEAYFTHSTLDRWPIGATEIVLHDEMLNGTRVTCLYNSDGQGGLFPVNTWAASQEPELQGKIEQWRRDGNTVLDLRASAEKAGQ